jgi:hypothetical protein
MKRLFLNTGSALLLALALHGHNAQADTLKQSLDNEITALTNTKNAVWDYKQELSSIGAEAILETQEAIAAGLKKLGLISLNGSNPGSVAPGAMTSLTFSFIDPSTGAVVAEPVSAVNYYAWTGMGDSLDPSSSTWMSIGSSTNAGSGFSLPYTFSSTEQIFLGVPLDPSGAPIVITGVGGYNNATDTVAGILTPEPAGYSLLGTGLAAISALVWRRRTAERRPPVARCGR